ncbi:MAG: hypothetical protein M3R63_17815, partial [Actinomycetota bacterium]|nr:hypothetical protein [Actinomycetota bacterium]
MSTTRRTTGRVPDETPPRHERFARAVDSGVHELSDQTLERELAVVAALRHAGAAVGPSTDEVDRMRQRVMAGFADTDFAAGSSSRVTLLTAVRPGRHARRRAPSGAEA